MLCGSLLYLFGTFLVTIVRNVPMNNALERGQPTGDDASDHWARYEQRQGSTQRQNARGHFSHCCIA